MIKTHTFRLGKYYIDFLDNLDGYCKVPSEKDTLNMLILKGGRRKALTSAIHESMHTEGVPDRFLDGDRDSAEHIARFLWRLGYRKVDTK